jgi:hypothetical protein
MPPQVHGSKTVGFTPAKKVSRGVPPCGVEQKERPDEEHGTCDQPNAQRAYPRPQSSESDHDPLVISDHREGENQDQWGMAYERPRRVSGDDRPKGLVSPGDYHQRDEGRVEDRREGEEDTCAGQRDQADAAWGTRLWWTRGGPPGSHDAPGQQSYPQDALYVGRNPVLGGVIGKKRAPIDAGNPRTDYERERRTERDRAEDRDTAENDESPIARPRTEGPLWQAVPP